MPTVDEDQQGNLGFTWMESSISEKLSMWIGDYSSTVVDPSDGRTFWSANEYIGDNGGPDPFTATHNRLGATGTDLFGSVHLFRLTE